MAEEQQTQRITKAMRWGTRVAAADQAFKLWEDEYKCPILEKYFLGHQWKETERGDHYTINLCYPTIETKVPSMLFFRPKIHVSPKTARGDDPGSKIEERSTLLEDTAQTFMSSEETGTMENANLALRESFYRFGVVQVMYSLDFEDNPNVGRPVMREDSDAPFTDSEGQPVLQGKVIAKQDNLYVKWIPANTFRVGSTNAHNVTHFNDWLGYYEWQYREDILRNPAYKNRGQVKAGGTISAKYYNPQVQDPDDRKHHEMIKVWKIWDLREKVRHVFPEGGDKFFIEAEPWTRSPSGRPFHPFAFLRRCPILNSWYPLPPMFNWLGPQDELNETRDMQKVHRKRAYRRNLVQKGAIEDSEMRKLESGGDMVWAEVARLDCIKPMEDAPLDRAVTLNVPTTKEDFLQVTGVGGDRRGVAEAETATQASIIDTNAKIRDSYERAQVGKFMGDIARLIIETIRAKFTLPMVIEVNVDPMGEFALNEVMRVAGVWQQATAKELGAFDFELEVDVESLSPVTEDQQRAQWGQVLGILSNPTICIALLASPTLLKKTLSMYGVRTSKEVAEITQAMQVVLGVAAQQQQAALAAKSGTGASAAPPQGGGGPTPQQSPDVAQIMRQLQASGVGEAPNPS